MEIVWKISISNYEYSRHRMQNCNSQAFNTIG